MRDLTSRIGHKGASFLKKLAVVAMVLMVALAWCQDRPKPYAGVNVTIRSTRVAGGILKIEAQSTLWRPVESHQYRSFVLSCHIAKPACVAPEVGEIYVLQPPSAKDETCDNYDLGRKLQIPVCLVAVH